jgi:ureidoacrylate peracid hydrolase
MDMEHAALLIIDMQNDFIHPDGFVRKSSRGIGVADDSLELLKTPIPCIKQLAQTFRATGREVIYVYTAWQPDYSDIALPLRKMGPKAREQGALVIGSWGAQIIEELSPEKGDLMLMKKAYGAFFQTSLDRTLRNRRITTLLFTGVATNYCVETTAREAVAYGYDIILIKDGCATFDPAGHDATLKVISTGFGEVMTADEVLQQL